MKTICSQALNNWLKPRYSHDLNFDNFKKIIAIRLLSKQMTTWLSCMMLIYLFAGYTHSATAQVRVMSYNIHYGLGMDKVKDLERIADVINRAAPDIVGLQEIADSLMAEEIAILTNMKVVFGPSLGRMDGYGDAVLSKYPFEWEGNTSIPTASLSRYQAMSVLIDFSEKGDGIKQVRLINTHFDFLKTIASQKARLAAIEVIDEFFLHEYPPYPTILTGDLNAVPDDEVIKKMSKYGWLNTSHGVNLFTHSSVEPIKQIDYIFCRPADRWKIENTFVMYGETGSDHLPVVSDLTLSAF